MPWPSQFEKLTTNNVRAMLLMALDSGENVWFNDIVLRTTSDQASEQYAWLGAPPAMNEFIGKRKLNELKELSFIISNKDYENNIAVRSKDMRRDKTGQIQIRINQLAERVNDHPASLISTLILAGESTVAYDGQFFFDTDHVDGDSGTVNNDITYDVTTTTAPTADEMSAAIVNSIQQMYGFKDDKGVPINQSARSFDIMVPIPFMGAALQARAQLLGAGGATAQLAALQGIFNIRIVPNPRLTWTTKFATFRTDGGIRPFILQEDPGGRGVVAIGDGSEHEQMHKEQIFGVDWSGNVGYGYFQGAVLTTLV